MSSVKKVLTFLCDTINMCYEENILKPEYFLLNNEKSVKDEAINSLTKIIEDFAQAIVIKELGNPMHIQQISDNLSKVKLLMFLLDYPLLNFLFINTKNIHFLNYLISAFGWLIVEKRSLEYLVYNKLRNMELNNKKIIKEKIESVKMDSIIENNIDSLIKNCGKLSFNLKHISELMSTKVNMLYKIQSISEEILGIKHLNVQELALLKRITENIKDESEPSKDDLKELQRQAVIISYYFKFKKNISYFIEWIVLVQNDQDTEFNEAIDENCKEVFKFLHLIGKIIKTNLNTDNHDYNIGDICPQLMKVDKDLIESEILIKKLVQLLNESTTEFNNQKNNSVCEFTCFF